MFTAGAYCHMYSVLTYNFLIKNRNVMSDKSMLTGEWEVSKSLMLTLVVFAIIVVGGFFIYKWQMNKKAKKEDPESKPAGSSTTTASGVTTEAKPS